ncbi:MAG: 6,7-dimethyl-8-ribityllumazine synthase [Bacteroidetes bacterium]|nr:6,7-dimethyl-8-ribityllumazine synthase [Bacteroidota bacterium]
MTQPGHDLSHIHYQGTENHRDTTVAIVASKWNPEVLEALLEGAWRTLVAAGIPEKQVLVYRVPGSYELPTGAQFAVEGNPGIDAVICLGCVVQGETRHFEFINQAVAQGVKDVSLKYNLPVIFGVLTPDTNQQALDRAGGKYGNKGEEAAVAALEMIDLKRSL